jgi:hypothetical protein
MAFHRKRAVAYWVTTFERAKIKLKIIYGAIMTINARGNHNKWYMIKAFKSLNFNNLEYRLTLEVQYLSMQLKTWGKILDRC